MLLAATERDTSQQRSDRDEVIDDIVVLAGTLGLVLVVGTMSHRFVEQPLLRVTRRAAGSAVSAA